MYCKQSVIIDINPLLYKRFNTLGLVNIPFCAYNLKRGINFSICSFSQESKELRRTLLKFSKTRSERARSIDNSSRI